MRKVKCPYCGYHMPIYIGDKCEVKDLYVKCKGKNCKEVFEIKIEKRSSSAIMSR